MMNWPETPLIFASTSGRSPCIVTGRSNFQSSLHAASAVPVPNATEAIAVAVQNNALFIPHPIPRKPFIPKHAAESSNPDQSIRQPFPSLSESGPALPSRTPFARPPSLWEDGTAKRRGRSAIGGQDDLEARGLVWSLSR